MAASRQWVHEDVFDARPMSVAQVRWFVAQHLREHDLGCLVDDVQLVASELATNAMLHAQTPFTASLEGFDDFVFLTVLDGSGSQPLRLQAGSMAVGGRGLSIVEELSSDWGVHDTNTGGKWIWAAFDRATNENWPTARRLNGPGTRGRGR
jgi:hypothetical protein